MAITPQLKIERFEQLSPGDLFIWPYHGQAYFGLKVIDPERNGERLILPLGPSFPPEIGGPRLIGWQGVTTASFAKDYTLRLPTAPEGWTELPPGNEVFCLGVTTDGAYFRANFSPHPGVFRECWVRVADGVVHYGRVKGITLYATQWEILVEDKIFPALNLLKYPP